MFLIVKRDAISALSSQPRVFVASTRPMIHQTFEEAQREAARLSRGAPNHEFVIFQAKLGITSEVAYNTSVAKY